VGAGHKGIFEAGKLRLVSVSEHGLGKVAMDLGEGEEITLRAADLMTQPGEDAGVERAHGHLWIDDKQINRCDGHRKLPSKRLDCELIMMGRAGKVWSILTIAIIYF
jgi:hypothetical protein